VQTQVAVIGAGPAGLLLAHLLARRGIESVLLEARSRAHCESRVRAGVLEQGTVDLLCASGVGERLLREGLVHRGIELRFGGERRRIDLSDLTGGRAITVYGQQELVKDLIAARLAAGGALHFEVEDVTLHELDSAGPRVRYRSGGRAHELRCAFVAGCDGYRGVSRAAVPAGALREYARAYPFSWLGILADAPPASAEIVYAHHERGFALHSMRSAQRSRLYVQCPSGDALASWPDARIWEELRLRLGSAPDWQLREGPILERGITALRSFVVEPLRWGQLFLVGDAGHVVPATGAKGLNLAAADARVLAGALAEYFASGAREGLETYSEVCLRRVWRVQEFSAWFTALLHRFPDDADGFQGRLQRAQLAYLASSRAAATALAENYVGLERV
jgi:p-hydroxybenzoate 3-monooxygenase